MLSAIASFSVPRSLWIIKKADAAGLIILSSSVEAGTCHFG